MNKFKPGDRVRWLTPVEHEGSIVTIYRVRGDFVDVQEDDGHIYYGWMATRFELVPLILTPFDAAVHDYIKSELT